VKVLNRLRHKLLFVFLAATLLPLAAILWASSALMERSLSLVSNDDVEKLAGSLEDVARAYYRSEREELAADAASGSAVPERFLPGTRNEWPSWLQRFWDSGESERFVLSEPGGESLHLAARRDGEAWVYTKNLEDVRMGDLARQLQQARSRAGAMRQRDLPRGFTLALLLAAAAIWFCALGVVFYVSGRISQPIQQLSAGLMKLAG